MHSKQLNILLADDDFDDCQNFKEALEALPIAAENIFSNGKLEYILNA